MGRESYRKIRTVTEEYFRKYSRKSIEKKTIFVLGPNEDGKMKVSSRTLFRYEEKMISKYRTNTNEIGWGKLVSKLADENHIPYENVRYNN